MKHLIKLLNKYERSVFNGDKPFELRKNDRNYKVGDFINFIIVDEKGNQRNTDELFQITFVLKNVPELGLASDYCILGIVKTCLVSRNY